MDLIINNNDFMKQLNNIIIVIFVLFIIIFIILFYLIYKINNIKSLEGFNGDEITNAVNAKYEADVEAIRNLSDIAKSLASTNMIKIPADLEVAGKITNSNDIISSGNLTIGGTTGTGTATVTKLNIREGCTITGLNSNSLQMPTIVNMNALQIGASGKGFDNDGTLRCGNLTADGANLSSIKVNSLNVEGNINCNNGSLNIKKIVIGDWTIYQETNGFLYINHNNGNKFGFNKDYSYGSCISKWTC